MMQAFQKEYPIPAFATDRFDRLKLSQVLNYIQQIAGDHCVLLGAHREALMEKGLFWAVIRHRVQITRLPRANETLTVQTWPMPTTRTAFPRSTVAYDAQGNECFRAISLWVLMDAKSRAMVLPGKTDVAVAGALLGSELAAPGSIVPHPMANSTCRTVLFTDLDVNGHMNNCRYLDWVCDILPSPFHQANVPAEFTVCYLSEATEGEALKLDWELTDDGCLTVNALRENEGLSTGHSRVFSAKVRYRNGVL